MQPSFTVTEQQILKIIDPENHFQVHEGQEGDQE